MGIKMKRKILDIKYDKKVIFQERLNRFTVSFSSENDNNELAHLHDTGRMQELLIKGNKLLIKKAKNPNRKTKWDVIAVEIESDGIKENVLINSSYHRYIAEKILKDEKISPFGKIKNLKAEIKYGNSRLDFYLEKNNLNGEEEKIFIETKGCTLVDENKIAKFPGAPSERATKHLIELMNLVEKGYTSVIIILIFRNSNKFMPEFNIDPLFSKTYYEAKKKGVKIYGLLFSYSNGHIYFEKYIDIL